VLNQGNYSMSMLSLRFVRPGIAAALAMLICAGAWGQSGAAMDQARKKADSIARSLGVAFVEVQTPHFLIFTDWDEREYGFLEENLEGAYSLLSKFYGVAEKQGVFKGKLPVYMIAKKELFAQFAREVDGMRSIAVGGGVIAGYYRYDNDGGHMAMWKPDVKGTDVKPAMEQWAYVLTHEFSHAFLRHYKSRRDLPSWMDEGLAEVLAAEAFPSNNRRKGAKKQLDRIEEVLSGAKVVNVGDYAVAQTLVEMLIEADREKFMRMVGEIKAGMSAEASLKKNFGVDSVRLAEEWRGYVKGIQ
jgi:hypothetical protein